MSKRFGAAVFGAMVLHAALIGFAVLRRSQAPRRLDTSVVARASEIEVSMVTEGDAPSRQSDRASSADEALDRTTERATLSPHREPSARNGSTPDATAQLDHESATDGAAVAELGSGAEQEGSPDASDASDASSAARPRVNLGLDGSIMRQATLAARERPHSAPRKPRRPPFVVLSHWSQGAVQAVAQKSAPPDGSALLTLEWNSAGQLVSITSSAASSHGDEWSRLAQGLSAQLAARPNTAVQGRGLRVVYLVKTDLVLPENKRSLLPSARYASAEQLRENNLPPATAINLGIKADNSAATTRVVSVEMLRSDAL